MTHAALQGFPFPEMCWMLCGASDPESGGEGCWERV